MLLALVTASYALTVPLRVTLTESVSPGEDAVASTTLTATVAVSHPTTGEAWPVRGDALTVLARSAEGEGGLTLAGDPAGSLRTWAFYLLDTDGELLGEPVVADVLFDDAGATAAIVARDTASTRVLRADVALDGGSPRVTVEVADTDAALVGIVELRSDREGSELVSDPDLSILDAAGYAAFQGLGLDAIVALDRYRTTMDGSVEVDGLDVDARGTVEGGDELRWDVTWTDVAECGRQRCQVTVAGGVYFREVGRVRPKATTAPRVALRPTDAVFDSYDTSVALTVGADLRGFGAGGSLTFTDGDRVLGVSDALSLDPSALGVEASGDDHGAGTPILETFNSDVAPLDPKNTEGYLIMGDALLEVVVYDSGGGVLSSHDCVLDPTADTVAGTAPRDVLLGTCTRADDDAVAVDRLRVVIDDELRSEWQVNLSGPAFAGRSATACTSRVCPEVDRAAGWVELLHDGVPFLTTRVSVAETTFTLPFAFGVDVGQEEGSLSAELWAPEGAIWSVADGVVRVSTADGATASFAIDELELDGVGLYALRRAGGGWNATDATPQEASDGPLGLAVNFTNGQATRMNAQCTTYR